ncbi:MAG: tandem-95 repeat protein [Paraglaciecola sp.]|nr:tandem-95 repeat protein [Paraglaciecola sp.]
MMLMVKKEYCLNVLLVCIFATFFSLQAYAQPAKIIPLAEWGSNSYEDVVELDGYYYFKQSNSSEIEVYASLENNQSARIGSISLDNHINEIFKFNGLLVVVDDTTLSLYSVDGLADPERIYGITIGSGYTPNGTPIAVNDNKLVYASPDNKVFVIQAEDNEYSIFNVYDLNELSIDQDSTIYSVACGFFDSNIYIAYFIQEYENNIRESRFVVVKLSLESDLSVSLEFTIDPLNASIRMLHYLKDGAFLVDLYADELYIYGESEAGYGLLDTVAKVSRYTSYNFSSDGNNFRMLNDQGQLLSYNMSDLTDIVFLDKVELNDPGLLTTKFSFHTISKIESGLIAISQNTIFNIALKNGQYVNHSNVFYRGGDAKRVVVKDDRLYIPINNKINVVDISSIDSPSLLNQITASFSQQVGNLYSVEDDILALSNGVFDRYILDEESIPRFNSRLDTNQNLNHPIISGNSLFASNSNRQIMRYNVSSANSHYELPYEYEPEYLTGNNNYFYIKVIVDDYLIVVNGPDLDAKLLLLGDVFESITFLSSLDVEAGVQAIIGFDGYVYTIDNRTLNIYQIDNDELVTQNSLSLPKNYYRLDIVNGFLLISGQNNGSGKILLYSLIDPAVPELLSTTKLKDGQFLWHHSEVVIDGSNLFITQYSESGKILILQLNQAPELAVTNYTFEEDTPLIIDLSGLDPENEQIQVEIIVAPESGELIFNEAEQSLNYQPAENFFGEQTAHVKLLDPHGNFSESVINFSISAVNDLPVFSLTSIVALEGQASEVFSLATDVENDGLSYEIISESSEGVATINEEGELSFISSADFNGETTITVSVTDGHGDSVEQVITITVQDVNDAPVISSLSFEMTEDVSAEFTLDIVDIENDLVTLSVVDFSDGIASVDVADNNKLSIDLTANFNGQATVTVNVIDDRQASENYTLTFDIAAVDDLPDTGDVNVDAVEGTNYSGVLPAVDVDGETLEYSISTNSINGTVTLESTGAYTYAPTASFTGSDEFTYTVTDTAGNSVEGKVNISVKAKPVSEPNNTGGGSIFYILFGLVLIMLWRKSVVSFLHYKINAR